MSYRLLYQNLKQIKKFIYLLLNIFINFIDKKIYFVPITLIIVKLVLPLVFFSKLILLEFKFV